jgi:2C-methyl-D-erythritol 2,4-cyclodiphosphate synthase
MSTYSTTKYFLTGTELPKETRTYKPVSHGQLIDVTLESIHKAGFKLGVSDIIITHASPGLKEFTSEFNDGQKWFLEKWKGKL